MPPARVLVAMPSYVVSIADPRGVERWTPRVSITVMRAARAKRAFGREQLKPWRADGSPQAELDFKFYRQATNKIGGISEEAGRFLEILLATLCVCQLRLLANSSQT